MASCCHGLPRTPSSRSVIVMMVVVAASNKATAVVTIFLNTQRRMSPPKVAEWCVDVPCTLLVLKAICINSTYKRVYTCISCRLKLSPDGRQRTFVSPILMVPISFFWKYPNSLTFLRFRWSLCLTLKKIDTLFIEENGKRGDGFVFLLVFFTFPISTAFPRKVAFKNGL